jgi:hypothetical protein
VSGVTSPNTTDYDVNLAQVFHNWTSLCTFTPTVAGDYYLQVRTNVALTGTPVPNTSGRPSFLSVDTDANSPVLAANGNTSTGQGINAFGIRAVAPTGYEKAVSVSGYDRMPIWANSAGTSPLGATFNLIRVLPGARGQFISFQAYDLGDVTNSGTVTGTVTIKRPADATGSITTTPFPTGCRASGGYAGSGQSSTSCSFTITNTANNGQLETFSVPIPNDYSCPSTDNSGCWYQVQISFGSGTAVNDVTTWNAAIVGDPVRIIQ